MPLTAYDIAVIGAGPGGLAAAVTAANAGRHVAIIDSGPRAGGQYWRHRPGDHVSPVFGRLRTALSRVDHLAGAEVWFAERGTLQTTHGEVRADRLIIATGAHDRVFPFPGWDLPGVITAGGAQALLKGDGVPAGRRIAVAGTGPFLLPVATGLARAGARVVGVFESANPLAFSRHPRALAQNGAKLAEAAGYAADLVRLRVPFHARHTVVEAHGEDGVTAVTVESRRGRRRVECDALAIGYGFTARLELPIALGCETGIGDDGGLTVIVDDGQRTSVPDVYAAGEVTGIGGADLALIEGRIAGAAAAGRPITRKLILRRTALRRFAAAMHAVYASPADWPDRLRDDTLVCRCEEVPYERVAHAVRDLGATQARTVKQLARPGMGWCQGRQCGHAVACLTAHLCGRAVTEEEMRALAARPIAAPTLLSDLTKGGEP